MQPDYSQNYRKLGAQDHRDLQMIVDTGGSWYELEGFAQRPLSEVKNYLMKNLPFVYQKAENNEKAKS
jgi:hypothetical protein